MDKFTILANHVQIVASVIAIISAFGAVFAYIKIKFFRTEVEKRKDWQSQFDRAVMQLSDKNVTSQLAAAVILRRFFDAEIDKDRFRKETINVISSLLKILPTGIFQKTLGDGLATAVNLDYADLQRTNLQDLYIGVDNRNDDLEEKQLAEKKRLQEYDYSVSFSKDNCKATNEIIANKEDDFWKIRMDFTDLFESNLSYALMQNIKGFGTKFYGAIMMHTQIKNCEFINADFRGVDFMHARFENVILTGSNFKNAQNIPEEIVRHLDKDKIYHDAELNNSSEEVKMKREITTSSASPSEMKNIFFSMPGSLTKSDEYVTLYFKELMNKLGYNPVYYTRDHYPMAGQLSKVKHEISQSIGMIAFGFKQIKIVEGFARPDLPLEVSMSGEWLPTPWNEIEVGMAVMQGLPILLVKDDAIRIGVFDDIINENKILKISTATDIKDIDHREVFKKWLNMLRQ